MLTNKKIKLGFLALILVLASTTTMAAQQWCVGKVTDLYMTNGGYLYVNTSWRNNYVRVCNINQTVGTITPQNCASWQNYLRSAVTNKENTLIFYNDAPACASMPSYDSAPYPGYVMLRD